MSCSWNRKAYGGNGGCSVNWDGKQSPNCEPYGWWYDNEYPSCRKKRVPTPVKNACTFDAEAYGGYGACVKGTKQSGECYPLQYNMVGNNSRSRYPTCRKRPEYTAAELNQKRQTALQNLKQLEQLKGVARNSNIFNVPQSKSFSPKKQRQAQFNPQSMRPLRSRQERRAERTRKQLADLDDFNLSIFDEDDVPVGDLIGNIPSPPSRRLPLPPSPYVLAADLSDTDKIMHYVENSEDLSDFFNRLNGTRVFNQNYDVLTNLTPQQMLELEFGQRVTDLDSGQVYNIVDSLTPEQQKFVLVQFAKTAHSAI